MSFPNVDLTNSVTPQLVEGEAKKNEALNHTHHPKRGYLIRIKELLSDFSFGIIQRVLLIALSIFQIGAVIVWTGTSLFSLMIVTPWNFITTLCVKDLNKAKTAAYESAFYAKEYFKLALGHSLDFVSCYTIAIYDPSKIDWLSLKLGLGGRAQIFAIDDDIAKLNGINKSLIEASTLLAICENNLGEVILPKDNLDRLIDDLKKGMIYELSYADERRKSLIKYNQKCFERGEIPVLKEISAIVTEEQIKKNQSEVIAKYTKSKATKSILYAFNPCTYYFSREIGPCGIGGSGMDIRYGLRFKEYETKLTS